MKSKEIGYFEKVVNGFGKSSSSLMKLEIFFFFKAREVLILVRHKDVGTEF